MPKKTDSGIPFLSVGYLVKDELPFLEIKKEDDNMEFISNEDYEYYSKRFDAEYNDILYSRFGTIGIAKLINSYEKLIASYSVVLIKPTINIIVPLFLTYALNSSILKKQAKLMTQGSSNQNFHLSDIRKLRIPLPPLREQQKIAFILSKVDEPIQKTDQVIEQTQRLKKGLMQRLLTKGIGHTKFKKTPIGEIPENWDIRRLGEVLDICQYGLSLKLSEHGHYPIFRMNNIENGYMHKNKMKFIDLDKETFEHYKLERGDLLFNRTNSSDLVGKIGLFMLNGEYTFASYLIRLRPKRERVNPLFLNFYLNTDFMQYKLRNLATPGVSQVNINAVNLKSVSIPIPTIPEQERIVNTLQNLDRRKRSEINLKEKLSDLKKGLMQKLLTGSIRVKV